MPSHEARQKAHYDKISESYEAHYSDPTSLAYRDRFIHSQMLAGVPLRGARVLDAMSGSGPLSRYLVAQGARVTGLDISPSMLATYRQLNPDCEGVCSSIFSAPLEAETFDVVAVVMGLHHLQPDLDRAIVELHRLLKPGGSLCFAEPHAGSLPDTMRRFWYRHDPFFESNEESIDLEALKARHGQRFRFVTERYGGSVAYILVLNSLILRIPLWTKRYYSPWAMGLEMLLNRWLPRWLKCAVMCRWVKVA